MGSSSSYVYLHELMSLAVVCQELYFLLGTLQRAFLWGREEDEDRCWDEVDSTSIITATILGLWASRFALFAHVAWTEHQLTHYADSTCLCLILDTASYISLMTTSYFVTGHHRM
jgi:hypothetical protein